MKVQRLVFQLLLAFVIIVGIGCSDSVEQSQSESKPTESKIADISNLKTGWYYIRDQKDAGTIEMSLIKTKETYFLDPNPIVTTEHIKEVSISETFNIKGIKVQLDAKGMDRWSEATGAHTNKYFGVVMNGQLINRMRIAAQDNFGNASFALHKVKEDRLNEVVAEFKKK